MVRTPTIRRIERRLFKVGNRLLMVPLLRAGGGWAISNPLSGYFLLLRTVGHNTGRGRETPLNYAIADGAIYCLAGFGEQTHWLANLRCRPHVQVHLPGRRIAGIATVVGDPVAARRRAVQVARNSGFALIFESPRCLLMSDGQLAAQLAGRPVVQIRPRQGVLVPGFWDPGGWGWLCPFVAQGIGLLGLRALFRRWIRRPG
jgi:deazaflavin-dependent oxidoreductase (nitroreductase family)